jgi:hypothetical protein
MVQDEVPFEDFLSITKHLSAIHYLKEITKTFNVAFVQF